ncbi:unnamed protein product [Protopolystoma xenopodis]|uniref:Uncharacterized protein n=1 Tax=Protopolystoma xenopodis TaxID=117903 RepID=A0A3S4ZXE4_9PLAT|nr:unnamed protein product [Protopolystoma xenopodis]
MASLAQDAFIGFDCVNPDYSVLRHHTTRPSQQQPMRSALVGGMHVSGSAAATAPPVSPNPALAMTSSPPPGRSTVTEQVVPASSLISGSIPQPTSVGTVRSGLIRLVGDTSCQTPSVQTPPPPSPTLLNIGDTSLFQADWCSPFPPSLATLHHSPFTRLFRALDLFLQNPASLSILVSPV